MAGEAGVGLTPQVQNSLIYLLGQMGAATPNRVPALQVLGQVAAQSVAASKQKAESEASQAKTIKAVTDALRGTPAEHPLDVAANDPTNPTVKTVTTDGTNQTVKYTNIPAAAEASKASAVIPTEGNFLNLEPQVSGPASDWRVHAFAPAVNSGLPASTGYASTMVNNPVIQALLGQAPPTVGAPVGGTPPGIQAPIQQTVIPNPQPMPQGQPTRVPFTSPIPETPRESSPLAPNVALGQPQSRLTSFLPFSDSPAGSLALMGLTPENVVQAMTQGTQAGNLVLEAEKARMADVIAGKEIPIKEMQAEAAWTKANTERDTRSVNEKEIDRYVAMKAKGDPETENFARMIGITPKDTDRLQEYKVAAQDKSFTQIFPSPGAYLSYLAKNEVEREYASLPAKDKAKETLADYAIRKAKSSASNISIDTAAKKAGEVTAAQERERLIAETRTPKFDSDVEEALQKYLSQPGEGVKLRMDSMKNPKLLKQKRVNLIDEQLKKSFGAQNIRYDTAQIGERKLTGWWLYNSDTKQWDFLRGNQ